MTNHELIVWRATKVDQIMHSHDAAPDAFN